MRAVSLVVLAGLFLTGCSTQYGIQVIQGLPEEIYLTFDAGSQVQIGDVFILYHVQQALGGSGGGGGHSGHGGGKVSVVRHEVGRVQVVRLADATHAQMKVLSGTVSEGLTIEKAQ
jgi:hypothetical protein